MAGFAPEAIYQRMNKRALAFLQDLIRQALAKVQALEKVCDDGLFTSLTKVYLADSTGFGLPDSLHDLFPGAGGSAAKAGAKMQAVWDYKSSVFGHCALTPWNIPDQKYVDNVVALAQPCVLFLFDLGYFKVKAFARIAEAGAYFLRRLNQQTTIFDASAGQVQSLELARFLQTVEGNSIEKPIFLGAKERVASRLIAYRLPEPLVNERRRIAKKKAKKKGYTPSKTHLELLAWNLFITNVPHTIWKPETVGKAYPIRWRMLLILFNYALCPQMRHHLWVKKHRELSVLKLVRHFQALADRWMQVIFQSEFELHRFIARACATAERLATKASRKRRTTAQILRESLEQQHESVELAEAIHA